MDLRHPKWIDLNPKAGNSFWGLTRSQAKSFAMVLIVFSIMLMSPPIIPDFTEIINIALARWIVSAFNISTIIALTLTYTVIPWAIFLLGIYIFPAPTHTVFNGYMNKLKTFVRKQTKNPIRLIFWIIIGWIMFNWYKGFL